MLENSDIHRFYEKVNNEIGEVFDIKINEKDGKIMSQGKLIFFEEDSAYRMLASLNENGYYKVKQSPLLPLIN